MIFKSANPGRTRITKTVCAGNKSSRSRIKWRNLRFAKLRWLARINTFLGTTKPTRHSFGKTSPVTTCATSAWLPAWTPRRIAKRKSSGSFRRLSADNTQADSFARPLRRRLAMIARPARVRMRRRKPWVLDRRRLFGWKVRFDTIFLLVGRVIP